jgi:hypothetical protein
MSGLRETSGPKREGGLPLTPTVPERVPGISEGTSRESVRTTVSALRQTAVQAA